MPRARTRHGDLTARTKADLTAKHVDEQEAASRRMALIDAQAKVQRDDVLDLEPNAPKADEAPPVKEAVPTDVDLDTPQDLRANESDAPANQDLPQSPHWPPHASNEVEAVDVEVEEPKVVFRVNETIEGVTIGYGNNYDFIEGQRYRAPKTVYDHLEEKGLIYH